MTKGGGSSDAGFSKIVRCPVTDQNDRLNCISACMSWEIFINI